jgi:ATP-dependent DNA helicase RecG
MGDRRVLQALPGNPYPMPTAFTTATPLADDELRGATVRWPAPERLKRRLKLDGAKAAQGAETLGLETVGDLLEHLPRDRREARTVADLIDGETATVVVDVKQIAARAVRRRGMRPLVEATVADASGSLRVTFFNQPWLVGRYPPGTRLMLHGKADGRGRFTVQGHAQTDQRPGGVAAAAPTPASTPASGPSFATLGEFVGQETTNSPTVEQRAASVAHYPATDGLSSTQILALVHQHAASFDDVIDPLPVAIRLRERLTDRPSALRAAHFPVEPGDEEQGRRRLAFDELLLAQLALQQRRRHRRIASAAPVLNQTSELTSRWLKTGLPFPLTGDQQAAITAIDADLVSDQPMQRLLMGEVGSGKTVVALYAMLRAMEHDLQAALMAPTETLAEQHFATIQTLLGAEPVRAGLLTGSTSARRRADLLAKLATGELSMIVGTHALIEDTVEFNRLAVVVVDEQHRFGVSQRAALDRKGRGEQRPHVLHMTATPIPRTLALSRHGDLDHTTLKELPRGRQPIATHLCSSEAERERAYARIRSELAQGRQAFVVCPLVEESETLQARAAVVEFERLKTGPFKEHKLVLMHGQMRPAEKQAAMAAFASGAAEVLVATTVIEVGIDVPNATVMLVEDADRYGISQLHQLRGRVGRGQHASLCLLFGRKDAVRLQALERESDGFALAEIDLQLRGQGELAGTRQSGEAMFRFAEFPRDNELMERAHRYSRDVIDADPDLKAPEHALLADALAALYGDEARAPIRA